jgi:hypothetical protein
MTSAPPDVVASWFPDDLRPDDIAAGFPQGTAFEPYEMPSGTEPVWCWWD